MLNPCDCHQFIGCPDRALIYYALFSSLGFFVQFGALILNGWPNSRYGLLHILTLAFNLRQTGVQIAICLPRSSVAQAPVMNETTVRLGRNTNYDTIPQQW